MSKICSKMAIFLFLAYFGGHFCYHSNHKSRINARLLHFGYCSNKLIQRNLRRATFIFWPHRGGGQNSLLMHILCALTVTSRPSQVTCFSTSITEASSIMRALSGARCTDVRLYTLWIKIGTNQRALGEHPHYWTRLGYKAWSLIVSEKEEWRPNTHIRSYI